MASWPAIQDPQYPLVESVYKRQLRTPFESGHVLSRAGSTVSKRLFQLNWSALPESQYQTLKTFFVTNIGLTFTWTHPLTLEVITARFSEDTLQGTIPFNGYREVSINIEEAP